MALLATGRLGANARRCWQVSRGAAVPSTVLGFGDIVRPT
jgi:hypothetical protein